jgi:hypothetical protein
MGCAHNTTAPSPELNEVYVKGGENKPTDVLWLSTSTTVIIQIIIVWYEMKSLPVLCPGTLSAAD